MAFDKVTVANHLPGKGDDRFPVYAKQLNEALAALNGEGVPQVIAMKKKTVTLTNAVTEDITTHSLTAYDSGSLILMDASSNSQHVNLPAVQDGLTYNIMAKEIGEFTITIIVNGTDDFVGTIGAQDEGDTAVAADTEILFGGSGTPVPGDWVSLTSDGAKWYVTGNASGADAVMFVTPE